MYKLLIPFILFPCFVFAQNTQGFYEHYTGLISRTDKPDSDLKLIADLVKTENTFSGYYYYQFDEQGMPQSSKPIALDGHIDDDNNFVLNEFGLGTSFFQGTLATSKLISGKWHNDLLKNPVDFTLKATYSQQSIPLKAYEYSSKQFFNKEISEVYATYHLSVLFPSKLIGDVTYYQLMKRIYKLLGYRGDQQKMENVIGSLEESYFGQFNSAIQNIQTDSFNTTFNWEKSIRVDVINNENALLCLRVDTYAKTGKQDGTRVIKYLVFDLVQNKVLKITDIVPQDKQQALSVLLQEKIRIHYHINAEKSLTDAGFFQDTIAPTMNFYLHPGGLGFYYNVYEIAPFSNGATDLFIPWNQLSGIIKSPLSQ